MTSTLAPGSPQSTWRDRAAWFGGEPIIEHHKTGMLMVLVAGGRFLAGGGKFPVELSAYYVGMHAVTNRQYGKFLGETKQRALGNKKWHDSGTVDHPVTDVSWNDAKAYCAWAGLRLPGELEWEKAARWVDGRKYPWGEEWDEKKCRNSGNKGSKETAGVWSYAGGTSPVGPYQMSGNVWEWCEDWYDANAYERYKRGDLKRPASGQYRVVRGGSWFFDNTDYFSASYRSLYDPVNRGNNYGFRCVMSADASANGGSR